MKKLCTYLTLFVLGLLAFAQPAAAEDATFYFQNDNNWKTPSIHWWNLGGSNAGNSSGAPVAMDKLSGTDNIYYKTITDVELSGNSSIAFYSTTGRENEVKFESGAQAGYLYKPNGEKTPYSVEPTDYTFYLNPGTVAWSDVYVYLFGSSDSKWDNVYQHYSTKLSNGYYKFEVKGVTKAGNMLFKSNNIGTWLGDKTDQSRDIEGTNVKNGALYTLGEMYNNKGYNNKGYNYTVTENYQEPGGHVVINIRGQFIDGDHEGKWGIPDYNRTMDWNESRGIYTYEATDVATKGGKFMVSSVAGDKFWDGRYESVSGGTLTIPSVQPDAANIKKGGGIDFTLPAAGTICFDLDALKIWYEPATTQKPVLTANPAGGEFETSVSVTLSANPDCAIYYTRNGNTPDASSEHYTGPITISETTTLKAIAILNGVSSEVATATYTKNQAGVYTGKLYVKGPGHSDWTYKELTNENGVFSFEVASVHTTFDNQNGQFVISDDGTDSMEHIFHAEGQDTYFEIPVKANAAALVHPTTEHTATQNFYVPAAAANGKVFIDMNDHKIWYEPKQETLPTELWAKGPGASGAWDKTIKLESDGNGLFHFTAYAADKFVISDTNNLGNDESGNSIFDKTAWGPIAPGVVDVPTAMPETANVEHVHQFENDFRATATNVIWFDAKNLKLWSGERILPTLVFEAGKAYYVDASAVAKDGKNWFENADCTLGVEYDGHVHFGGTIVKVSSDPLVYRFTVDEDQTEIVVGRLNNQGLHNPVTVKAPTDGSNCIFLDGSTGVLKLDHFGTYSPAGGLYILESSDAIEGDWKNATPIAMNYDATKDVFYYMVQGTNASADDPIKFLISRGATNSAFFNAANAFEPVRDGYIHMAEPSYMKGKPGYTDGNYFKLISRGRVMAKYIKAENSEEITGLKIWYEPVVWPDLYALGSIIAKPGDKKSELGDQTSQWHTFVKLEKDEKQPGLYYYDLGCGDKETKDLFNKEDYEAKGVFGKINEIGHFNFSFLSGTVTGEFWKDAFVPAVGQGMGTLNRDGVPVPFQYRDSDPGRYDREGGWTSTNFVFGERCRIWVDVVRQIVWVQPIVELSDNQVVFDFWDKGGKKYPDGNKYKWWSTTDKATRFAQVYIKDATLPEGTTLPAAYRITAEDLSWMSEELENGEAAGARYHFVASLPTDFFEADGKTVIGGGHLWVRIKNGDSGSHEMLRPYAYQATYTQGPESDPDFNKYGNILAKGDPIVTIEPSVNMIYADVEAPEHLGNFRESHIMHYPYVNQYSTAVTVNPGNVYPFWVEGLTEPAKNESGETIADQYVPVDGAPVVFEKSNQVTVSYGSIRETKYGTTGMAVIKGIDHANAAATDKMEVTVTYTSPGLIFARTKTEPLKIDANELPTMQTSQDNQLDVAAFYSGTACNQGLTVDLILHQKFEFRDIMTQGRAAYIGYEVKIDNPNDHSHVAEGHEHMAKNGVPLMWDFTDDHNRNIKGFTDLDKWHYKAFTGKSMAIQLHHVLCGNTEADLEGKTVTGTVTFHLYVPVATEFAFETGTTSLVRGMHKAGEQVNSSVQGDPNHPYTGSVSAKSYDSFTHEFTFNTNGNITTGVEGVGVEDAPVEFYNLQGVRMTSETLAPGIYIRRQGNETSKVYIR